MTMNKHQDGHRGTGEDTETNFKVDVTSDVDESSLRVSRPASVDADIEDPGTAGGSSPVGASVEHLDDEMALLHADLHVNSDLEPGHAAVQEAVNLPIIAQKGHADLVELASHASRISQPIGPATKRDPIVDTKDPIVMKNIKGISVDHKKQLQAVDEEVAEESTHSAPSRTDDLEQDTNSSQALDHGHTGPRERHLAREANPYPYDQGDHISAGERKPPVESHAPAVINRRSRKTTWSAKTPPMKTAVQLAKDLQTSQTIKSEPGGAPMALGADNSPHFASLSDHGGQDGRARHQLRDQRDTPAMNSPASFHQSPSPDWESVRRDSAMLNAASPSAGQVRGSLMRATGGTITIVTPRRITEIGFFDPDLDIPVDNPLRLHKDADGNRTTKDICFFVDKLADAMQQQLITYRMLRHHLLGRARIWYEQETALVDHGRDCLSMELLNHLREEFRFEENHLQKHIKRYAFRLAALDLTTEVVDYVNTFCALGRHVQPIIAQSSTWSSSPEQCGGQVLSQRIELVRALSCLDIKIAASVIEAELVDTNDEELMGETRAMGGAWKTFEELELAVDDDREFLRMLREYKSPLTKDPMVLKRHLLQVAKQHRYISAVHGYGHGSLPTGLQISGMQTHPQAPRRSRGPKLINMSFFDPDLPIDPMSPFSLYHSIDGRTICRDILNWIEDARTWLKSIPDDPLDASLQLSQYLQGRSSDWYNSVAKSQWGSIASAPSLLAALEAEFRLKDPSRRMQSYSYDPVAAAAGPNIDLNISAYTELYIHLGSHAAWSPDFALKKAWIRLPSALRIYVPVASTPGKHQFQRELKSATLALMNNPCAIDIADPVYESKNLHTRHSTENERPVGEWLAEVAQAQEPAAVLGTKQTSPD